MKLTNAARRTTMWSAVALAALVGPGMAVADQISPQFGGRHDGHRHGSGLTLQGRALSQQGEREGYAIEVRANAPDGGDASGVVRFGHRTAEAADGFVGEVRCLSQNSDGIVQLSGTIRRSGSHEGHGGRDGEPEPSTGPAEPTAFLDSLLGSEAGAEKGGRHGGGELAGKDFAFTIDVAGEPQRFSTARVADAGTLEACSAGEGAGLAVTRGGFRTTVSEGG